MSLLSGFWDALKSFFTGGSGLGSSGPINRLYVGNLSWDVKWQELKDFFKPCGTVVRADVMEEPGGRSKGCGK